MIINFSTMSLGRSLLRIVAPQLRVMSTQSAAAVSPQTVAEETIDDDQPVWGMSNPYEKQRQKCLFCKHNIVVDYKNVRLISQFTSQHTGKLYDRHITGLCRPQQDRLIRAYNMAVSHLLMSNYQKDLKYVRDPKLCDPFQPRLPHPH